LNTSSISLRPLSALSQNRSTIRSEADATGTDCDFLLQKLVDEREQIIKQLQDENKVRNKYYRQLEVITQKINLIPVPPSVKQVRRAFMQLKKSIEKVCKKNPTML
jgi:hypothetical protein